MHPVIVLVFVGFVIWYVLTSPKRKEQKRIQDEQLRKQLLNLFIPGEKIRGSEVSRRLKERTGGRKSLPDAFIHVHLYVLVDRKELNVQVTPKIIEGLTFKETLYFLPPTPTS